MRKRETVDAAAASPFKFLSFAHGAITNDTFVMPASTVVVFLTAAGASTISWPCEVGVITFASDLVRPDALADMLYQRYPTYTVTYAPGERVPDMLQTYGCAEHEFVNNSMGIYRLPLLKPMAGRTKELGQKKGQLVGRPGNGAKVRLSAVLRDLPALAGAAPTPQSPLVVFVHSCRGIWWDNPDRFSHNASPEQLARYAECARMNADASGIGEWCSPRPGRLDPTAMSMKAVQKCMLNQHTAHSKSLGIDWPSITGRNGVAYDASNPDDADRRERLSRAVRSLADAAFDGDVRAAAKRLAQRLGHQASGKSQLYRDEWTHMRSNMRWLKDTYSPSSATTRG